MRLEQLCEAEMIELRALGTAEIHTDSATLTPSQEIVFAAALYLIIEGSKPLSRARFASLLWPEAGERLRAHRLRQTLHQLKKHGFGVLADRNTVQLLEGSRIIDTDKIPTSSADLIATGRSLEFLPGYEPRPSEALRDWVDHKRSEIHGMITTVLISELETARRRGDWRNVEQIANDCLSLDDYNETAVLACAEALAMRGAKRKAIAVLDSYLAELGEMPSELRRPAVLLRKRVVERMPDRPVLSSPESLFVGRESVVEFLTERFARAQKGNGSASLILGDPGIGKSRVCAEIAKFVELQGSHVQRASCRRTHMDRPLSLFVDLVPGLRDLPGALGCDPHTFATLRRLTEFEKHIMEPSSLQSAEILFDNVKAALFDLFDSVVEERSLVVAIDDVQWLDPVSGKLLLLMAEWSETKRLWFLLNARHATDLVSSSAIEAITLDPLTLSASATLLRSMGIARTEGANSTFEDWCLTVAEGNPFFLQELAHHWIETGQRYEVPPSVAKILDERLNHLSADALQILQTAAILGDHSSIERIEAMLEFECHRFLAGIDELSKAAMLALAQTGSETSRNQFQPRHDLLSSAALRRLAPISLSFLHRRAADVIEKEFSGATTPTSLLWACANHRHQAGDREGALSLSVACAQHLLDLGLSSDSVAAFKKSLEYCVSDEERLRTLPKYAVALQMDGQWEECKLVLHTCIGLSKRIDPGSGSHNEFELQLLETSHLSSFDFATLLAATVQCVESCEASPSHRIRAAVLALKLATDFGPAELLDSIYSQVAPLLRDENSREADKLEVQIIYRTLRDPELIPIEELDHFAEVARRDLGELAHLHALVTASNSCRISGRFEEGLRYVERAFREAGRQRLFHRMRMIALTAVRLQIGAGEFRAGDDWLRRARGYSPPVGDLVSSIEILFLDTRIALEMGDQNRAETSFNAIETMRPTYSVGRRAYYYALGIQVLVRSKAHGELIEPLARELDKLHPLIRGIAGKDFEMYSLYLGLCAIGEKDAALTMLTNYVTIHRRSNWPLRQQIADELRREDPDESRLFRQPP